MTDNSNLKLSINAFARLILFGTTLEEKLVSASLFDEPSNKSTSFETPLFPGRPPKLLRIGNSKFPTANSLHQDTTRGQVLHFFANHELLAMELMALVLLKFPEAPPSFRMGIARTIAEEQNHMRLYLKRMQELGVEFGDLPLTDYFWNCLKTMKTPMDFVTQMSLTFEQANLDYSLYYRDEIAKHGDEKTALILDQVYREEIGHVKHGLVWFNQWRENKETETDWDAYKRLLPPPLTPRRAKGLNFCAKTRSDIGFSETFIRELEINSGSKGRPPLVWIYNPNCDAEIARGKPGFSASKISTRLSQDLEPLLMVLARNADMIWVKERPRTEWLKKMADDGFLIPEFICDSNIKEPKFSGFEPWGWSPDVFERCKPFKDRILETKEGRGSWNRQLLSKNSFEETGLASIFSKSWSSDFLNSWLKKNPHTHSIFGDQSIAGTTAKTYADALNKIQKLIVDGVVLKAPYGTSGNQVKRIRTPENLDEKMLSWIKNTIESQHGLVVEPLLEKLHDLSLQMELSDGVKLLETRSFLTDSHWQYRGTVLGRSSLHFFGNFSSSTLKFFNQALPVWQQFAKDLGHALINGGYQGPAGIDSLIWKNKDGELRLKPLIELNPRWTMGRIALELESHVVPGNRAAWVIFKKNTIDYKELEKQYPAKLTDANHRRRIESGIYWTTDPEIAKEVHTAIVVGDDALGFVKKSL